MLKKSRVTWIIIEMWTSDKMWISCRWRRSMSGRNMTRALPCHKRNEITWFIKACKKKSDIGTTKMRLMNKYLREGKRDEVRQKNDYKVKSKLSRVRARNLLEIEFDLTALWEQRISYKTGTWKSLSESWFWHSLVELLYIIHSPAVLLLFDCEFIYCGNLRLVISR